ncbi:hypothetical protein HC864_04360 [Candidatus Gracilibacteria bacterium]|nr:hypothetical protein [Candidatus Gracilibacteria bacterium]
MQKIFIDSVKITIVFKLWFLLLVFLTFTILQSQDYFGIGLFEQSVSWWDANIYNDIALNGYYKQFVKFPDSLIKYGFFPLLPIFLKLIFELFGLKIIWASIIVNTLNLFLLVINLKLYLKSYYNNEKIEKYILATFLIFPYSIFLYMNYTENLFLGLTFLSINLLKKDKIFSSNLVGFLLSLTRPNAIIIGIFNFIEYLKYKKKTILKSVSYLTYLLGPITLFSYFKIKFGNFWLFFDSQKYYFNKEFNPFFIFELLKQSLFGTNGLPLKLLKIFQTLI